MRRFQPRRRPVINVLVSTQLSAERGIIRGIADHAAANGWILRSVWPTRDWSPRHFAGVDGVLVRPASKPELQLVAKALVPCVVVTPWEDTPTTHIVTWDNRAIGALAAAHLLAKQHRNFVAVGSRGLPFANERIAGFHDAVAEQGATCQTLQVRNRDFRDWNSATAAKRVGRLLEARSTPLTMFCVSDPIARGMTHLLAKLGVAVPRVVAVLGVGDDEILCRTASPPISSVRLPAEDVGHEAAATLSRLLAEPRTPPLITRVAPTGVTERQSCDVRMHDDSQVEAALAFIREHACDGVQAGEVVEHVPLSRRSLEVRFRKVVGRTMQQEINRTRIMTCRELLTRSHLSVGAIAERCGFSSVQRLSEVFRRETGESPTDYRRRMQPRY